MQRDKFDGIFYDRQAPFAIIHNHQDYSVLLKELRAWFNTLKHLKSYELYVALGYFPERSFEKDYNWHDIKHTVDGI